jgi:hypothetical protein
MESTTVYLQGPHKNSNDLELALRGVEGVEQLTIKSAPVPNAGVMGRPPLNQDELVELAINFAIAVSSKLTADVIKAAVFSAAKKWGFGKGPSAPGNSTPQSKPAADTTIAEK